MKRLKLLACRVLGHQHPRTFVGTLAAQRVTFTACPRCRRVFDMSTGTRRQRRTRWRQAWKRR